MLDLFSSLRVPHSHEDCVLFFQGDLRVHLLFKPFRVKLLVLLKYFIASLNERFESITFSSMLYPSPKNILLLIQFSSHLLFLFDIPAVLSVQGASDVYRGDFIGIQALSLLPFALVILIKNILHELQTLFLSFSQMDFWEVFDHEGEIGSTDSGSLYFNDQLLLEVGLNNLQNAPNDDNGNSKPSLNFTHSVFIDCSIQYLGASRYFAEPACRKAITQHLLRLDGAEGNRVG